MTTEQANQLTAIYNSTVLHSGDKVLSWTNPSPTSAFNPQTVTISGGFSSYRYLIIECYLTNNTSFYSDTNPNTQYNFRSTSATETFFISGGGAWYRSATINVSAGTVIFSTGTYGGASNTSACIPYKIFGI